MKRIKSFETFINEAEDKKKDFEHLPRLKNVVDKEFFLELKQHIFYWLNYDFLNKKYEMTSLENDENEVVVWFCDKKETPEFQYKVVFTTIDSTPMVEKIENIKMIINIYEFENTELLKQTEMKVGMKYLNAESFNKFITKVTKRIIRSPKDDEDIEDFKRKEKRRLSDNIY